MGELMRHLKVPALRVVLLGSIYLGALAYGAPAFAVDDLDWSQPVSVELPPPTREIECAAGTNVQALM